MSSNILKAISNIAALKENNLKNYYARSSNRANQVGEHLEMYLKDALSGTFGKPEDVRERIYADVFAYSNSQNHPPDMIIKNGDAIEVKKIGGNAGASLALNSSTPKDMLHSNDPKIDSECRNCDGGHWSEKDIFYVVGYAKKEKLRYLFFVQGTCYAAAYSVYSSVQEPLKKEIDRIIRERGLATGRTNELGRINNVDPLRITQLRVRGMWQIKNPLMLFEDVCRLGNETFALFAVMNADKYKSFPAADRKRLEKTMKIEVKNISIKNPNNPAKNMPAILISFRF